MSVYPSREGDRLRVLGVWGGRLVEWPRVVATAIERVEEDNAERGRWTRMPPTDEELMGMPPIGRRVVIGPDSIVVNAHVLLAAEMERLDLAAEVRRLEGMVRQLLERRP